MTFGLSSLNLWALHEDNRRTRLLTSFMIQYYTGFSQDVQDWERQKNFTETS